MLYQLLKYSIAFGLHAFHNKIEVHGLTNVPKNKPVLFLPNHQNALIDVLLIGINCNRKPYFLARSDVFKRPILKSFFNYLKMIPVYRIRDGRNTVTRNHAIFETCAQLLNKGEAVTMFPEANHNLRRRVRPLSKGFTRVLFKALEYAPELDIKIVPVGLNYVDAELFPDAAAVYYGEPIAVQELYDANDLVGSALKIRSAVASGLKQLTTHVEPESEYDEIINYLKGENTDFLDPKAANILVENWSPNTDYVSKVKKSKSYLSLKLRPVFLVVNLPVLLFWKLILKPKIWEREFTGTLRFATAFIGFIMYLPILFLVLYFSLNLLWGFGVILLILLFNWIYVKQYPIH